VAEELGLVDSNKNHYLSIRIMSSLWTQCELLKAFNLIVNSMRKLLFISFIVLSSCAAKKDYQAYNEEEKQGYISVLNYLKSDGFGYHRNCFQIEKNLIIDVKSANYKYWHDLYEKFLNDNEKINNIGAKLESYTGKKDLILDFNHLKELKKHPFVLDMNADFNCTGTEKQINSFRFSPMIRTNKKDVFLIWLEITGREQPRFMFTLINNDKYLVTHHFFMDFAYPIPINPSEDLLN